MVYQWTFDFVCAKGGKAKSWNDGKYHILTHGKKNDKGEKKRKNISNQVNKDVVKCFFSKRKRRMKKACPKCKTWLQKKGNYISLACYKSNMVQISQNTWWIDFGSTMLLIPCGFLKPKETDEQLMYNLFKK